MQLQYPKYTKIKALKIQECKCSPEIQSNKFLNNNIDISFYQKFNQKCYQKNLNHLGIKTVINSSKTIRNLINNKNLKKKHIKSKAGVY